MNVTKTLLYKEMIRCPTYMVNAPPIATIFFLTASSGYVNIEKKFQILKFVFSFHPIII